MCGIFVKEGLPMQANKGGTADFGSVLLGQVLLFSAFPFRKAEPATRPAAGRPRRRRKYRVQEREKNEQA